MEPQFNFRNQPEKKVAIHFNFLKCKVLKFSCSNYLSVFSWEIFSFNSGILKN